MAQLTVPIVFDHDDLQRMVDEKIAAVKAQFIPKDQYEARLKADMVAMLEDLKQDFIAEAYGIETDCTDYVVNVADIDKVIQEKINSIKEGTDGNK